MPRLSTQVSTRHLAMVFAGLLFLGSSALAILNQWWAEAGIALILIPLVFAPLCAERWTGVRLPLNLQIQYGLLIVAGPYLGSYWNWYDTWSPWDTLVHFYSGFFISFVLVVALGKTGHAFGLELPVWLEMVLLIAVKAFIALLWEIAEFLVDLIFDTSAQVDNFDTMIDMMAALVPSLLIAAALYAYRQHGSCSYIGSLLAAGRGKI